MFYYNFLLMFFGQDSSLCEDIFIESPKRILPEKAHFLCEVQYGLDGGFWRLSALVHIVETLHFTITYTAARQRNG